MDLPHFTIENELRTMGSEQLRRERNHILNDLKSLQDQIGDLAFNNYRTYADAGRTTQHCTEIFTEMKEKLREVSGHIPELASELREFQSRSKHVSYELDVVQSACRKENPVWELLSLPSRMDVCIRAGYYEVAYSLTNYGMMLQQHAIIKNPLIKAIAGKLVEARSFLLEELFNKFSGPLDLASSIQVVNNVRKMPYLTPTQLRVCILQHREIYLDRQILDITNHPEFAIRAIEIYRDCLYDTLVLYLAVFPENESSRKELSLDPRWETWPSSAPSAVLGQWTARNITRLLDLIRRTDMKSGVDMCTVSSKLMSLAASLGRMGLDFRALVIDTLLKISLERFTSTVRTATNKFLSETKVLSVSVGEISSLSADFEQASSGPPQPSPEISLWDDICIYGNALLEALNNLRYSPTPMLIQSVVVCLRESLRSIVCWLLGHSSSAHFSKAVEILCLHFGPFIGRCIQFLFPYSAVTRLFGTSISPHTYEDFTELDMRSIAKSCEGGGLVDAVLQELSSNDISLLHKADSEVDGQHYSAPVKVLSDEQNVPEFTDTSMCSPSDYDSSTVRFDLGECPGETTVSRSAVNVSLSVEEKKLVADSSEKSYTADTQSSTVVNDDLPALVETSPSPVNSDSEANHREE